MNKRLIQTPLLFWLILIWAGGGVAAELPSLSRGVNLSHWLNYAGRQPVVMADMVAIRKAGFDHVRIPFDPGFLGWQPDAPGNPSNPLPGIAKLDAALELAIDSGLVAILDFHPAEALKARIETEPNLQNAFIRLWGTLASRYRDRPTDKLVFEVLNEPQFWQDRDPTAWLKLRGRALAAIRRQDQAHLILLSGRLGGGLEGLLEEPTVTDPAIAYTFHYYQPMLFTHLGATWEPHLSSAEGMISGLRYPPSANNWMLDPTGENIDFGEIRLKPGADQEKVREALVDYYTWGPSRMMKEFQKVREWSAAHRQARVICNEFGVLLPGHDLASRSAWLKDVRKGLESLAMGWTVWDYSDLFGIASPTGETYESGEGVRVPIDGSSPTREFRESDLTALGMAPR